MTSTTMPVEFGLVRSGRSPPANRRLFWRRTFFDVEESPEPAAEVLVRSQSDAALLADVAGVLQEERAYVAHLFEKITLHSRASGRPSTFFGSEGTGEEQRGEGVHHHSIGEMLLRAELDDRSGGDFQTETTDEEASPSKASFPTPSRGQALRAPRLCLRGTFIDVKEPQEEPVRRSLTDHAQRTLSDTPGEFDDELVYVAELSGKLSAGSWDFRLPERHALMAEQVVSSRQSCAEVEVQADDGEQTENDVDAVHGQISQASSGVSAGSSHSVAASRASNDVAASLSRSIDPEARLVHNVGSIGHPYLCSRPCLHFAAGQCANGSACDFCHVHHTRRQMHLTRKQRTQLGAIGKKKATSLLFQVVREKALAFDGSVESAAAVDRAAAACGVSTASNVLPPQVDDALVEALEGLSLRLVMITLQRVALREQVDTALAELLTNLRGAVRVG